MDNRSRIFKAKTLFWHIGKRRNAFESILPSSERSEQRNRREEHMDIQDPNEQLKKPSDFTSKSLPEPKSRETAVSFTELPGLDGMPYRNYPGETLPLFKETDPASMRPILSQEAHVDVIHMGDQKDVERLQVILNKISRRVAFICDDRLDFCQNEGNYIYFVRWMERFLESPKHARSEDRSAVSQT